MSKSIKVDAFTQLDVMSGLVNELIVDQRVQPEKFGELLLATESLVSILGFDLELGYSEEYDTITDMVEYAIDSNTVEQFGVGIDACSVESLLETLRQLRDDIEATSDDEDLALLICGWLNELALVVIDHGMDDFDVLELFDVFVEDDEFDDDYDLESEDA